MADGHASFSGYIPGSGNPAGAGSHARATIKTPDNFACSRRGSDARDGERLSAALSERARVRISAGTSLLAGRTYQPSGGAGCPVCHARSVLARSISTGQRFATHLSTIGDEPGITAISGRAIATELHAIVGEPG